MVYSIVNHDDIIYVINATTVGYGLPGSNLLPIYNNSNNSDTKIVKCTYNIL